MSSLKKIKFLILAVFILLSGCGDDTANLELSGLNYTKNNVIEFSVNGYYGGNIAANSGGGSFFCCIAVPRRWHKGLKVTVRWVKEIPNDEVSYERVVDVPPYGPRDLGFFAVHIYPDNSAKVLVTMKGVDAPGYPYPRSREK